MSRTLPVSFGYRKITLKAAKELSGAWLDKSLPESQWQVVAPIIKSKEVPVVAELAVAIIKRLSQVQDQRILDVGCSSGYYHDFLKWSGIKHKYTGCDVSPDFISFARRKHRWVDFRVAPITKLPYKANSFEVALASGIIHCELNYLQALRELARVSKKYVLLHRLPIFSTGINEELTYFEKVGYGVKMLEIIFNWTTLIKLFGEMKLTLKEMVAGDRLDIKTPANWVTVLLEK